MLRYDDLPDPGLSHAKSFVQTVSVSVPILPQKVGKKEQKQSIVTKKCNPNFREKVTTYCYDPDETLADIKDCFSNTTVVILKLIEVKFRISPENINYSTFQLG